MQKLPKEFKEKWIAALRSGKYEQGQDVLFNEESNTYCCLGVACHIIGIKKSTISHKCLLNLDNLSRKVLHKLPEAIIGSDNSNSDEYNEIVSKLVTYNDKGKSFKWIASYISRYL